MAAELERGLTNGMTAKERVMDWISGVFEDVETEDFPMLPGGTIVRDKLGKSVLVFIDAATGDIKWEFPDKKDRR